MRPHIFFLSFPSLLDLGHKRIKKVQQLEADRPQAKREQPDYKILRHGNLSRVRSRKSAARNVDKYWWLFSRGLRNFSNFFEQRFTRHLRRRQFFTTTKLAFKGAASVALGQRPIRPVAPPGCFGPWKFGTHGTREVIVPNSRYWTVIVCTAALTNRPISFIYDG